MMGLRIFFCFFVFFISLNGENSINGPDFTTHILARDHMLVREHILVVCTLCDRVPCDSKL